MLHPSYILLLLLLSSIIVLCICSDSEIFVCGDKSTTIPLSHVNDDYCDCVVDGSDESRTNACAHLGTIFQCVGEERNISTAFVNDGWCDCCDGSDEKTTTIVCENTCYEQKMVKTLFAQKELKDHTDGEEVKKTYMRSYSKGIKEVEEGVRELRQQIAKEDVSFRRTMESGRFDEYTIKLMYGKLMEKSKRIDILESLINQKDTFGPKKQFFGLLGKCFRSVVNEKRFKGGSFDADAKDFLFEFCPFKSVVMQEFVNETISPGQEKPKSTVLGVWNGWEDTSFKAMEYTNGDECWNGPPRFVRVELICRGTKEEIVRVLENGKCLYDILFATPAACNKNSLKQSKKEPTVHDEL